MSQPRTRQQIATLKKTFPGRELLELVAAGNSIRQIVEIAADRGVPSSTYYVCKALQAYGEDYAAAKRAKAALLADRLSEISESVATGKLDPASARIASDNSKWLASRLDPAAWGDKIEARIEVMDLSAQHLAALESFMPKRLEAKVVDELPSPARDPDDEI